MGISLKVSIIVRLESKLIWRCPHSVMVKVLDCGIVVSEFELQSHYYVHFRTNTIGKGMNPLIPPRYVLYSITAVLIEG